MPLRWSSVVALVALALAGCGDDAPTSPIETTAPSSTAATIDDDTIVVAALGDSITAGSPLWDPDPAIRGQIGPALDERSQFEYWVTKADPAIDFRNCGVFGERTDEIALRLDECAAGADALIVQGGINDIAQGRDVAMAAADIDSMVQRGLALDLTVAVTDVLPWNNGHPRADGPIEELNRSIRRIGDSRGVAVLPFHDTLEDPDEPGEMKADLTIDGDHPSVAGYRLLAEQAFELPK